MSRHCWLSMILTLLVACDSKPETAPSAEASAEMTEGVELELVQTMEAGGQFHLLNKTSEQISFRATNESPDGFHPSDARLKCQTANSDEWEEGLRPMGDSETRNVEVAPGRLIKHKSRIAVVQANPSERPCYRGHRLVTNGL